MNSWTQVIIEWANCLGIVDSSIESLQDLKDGAFYEKLVLQICRGNEENLAETIITEEKRELVSKFIEVEYPDFESVECTAAIPEELYTASLLLVQCSQQPMFHRPMCVALKHETQVRIKQFLEMVLPYGKNVTKETVASVIMELEDTTTSDPKLSPIIRPLREFFNSPAVKSARSQRFMNDRNRELMWLRAQLETEQFEKADLTEDLKKLNEKICSMQKKLDDKTRELRELRLDRTKPPTPQSCRKDRRPSDNEERYRREAESLETMNSQLMFEIEKLRDERDEVAHRLSSSERLNSAIREKYEKSEKILEHLENQLETKNKEIRELRMNSEELREHIRQMQRLSLGEQSFDVEPICDEALSSIVDIQLQEARKESLQLKNELAALKLELARSQRNCEELQGLEITLRDKTSELDLIKSSFRAIEEQLSSSNARATDLELENSRLMEKLTELYDRLREKDELLALTEERKVTLESEIRMVNSRIDDLQSSLANEKSRNLELTSNIKIATKETEDLQKMLSSTKEQLSIIAQEKSKLATMLEEATLKFEDSIVSLTNEKTATKNLTIMVATLKEKSEELERKLSLSEEETLIANENKRIVEANYESIVKKLETTERWLNEEKSRLEDSKLSLLEAHKDIERLKTSIESKEELLNDEKTKVAELQTTVRCSKSEYERMQVTHEELKIALQTETEESNKLRDVVSRLKQSSQEFESLLRLKSELLEECSKREISLKKELESCQAESNDLKETLRNETVKSGDLQSRLTSATKYSDELEEKLTSKDRTLTEKEAIRKNLEDELNLACKRIEETESNLERLRTELIRVQEEEKRCTLAKKSLEEYAKAADEKIIAEEMKISEYEERIKQLDECIALKNKNLDEILNELKEQNTMVNLLKESSTEAEKRETRIADSLLLSEKKIDELTELCNEMKDQKEQEIQKSNTLRHENEELREKVSNYILSMNNLDQQIIQQKMELESTREELRNEFSLREELARRIEDSSTRNVELEEILKLKEKEYTIVLEERDSLRENLTSCISEIKTKEEEITALEEDIEKARKNREEDSSRIQELKKQLETLLAKSEQLAEEIRLKNDELTSRIIEEERVKKELTSYVSETSTLRRQVETMQQKLKKSEENHDEVVKTNGQLMEKIRNLHITNNELEEKLTSATNRLTSCSSERDKLKEEIASRVIEASMMKERLENIELELSESQDSLKKESSISNEIRKNLEASRTTIQEIEEKWVRDKNQLEIVSVERDNLKTEIASFESKTSEMGVKLDKAEKEIEEYVFNLRKQIDENSEITKREFESKENLTRERERVKNLETEITRLEKELSSFVRSNEDMVEKIKVLSEELECTRRKNENLEKTEKECTQLRQRVTQLNAESEGCKEEIRSLKNALEIAKFENERLTEKLEVTGNTVTTLEKRLLVAENAREEVKLEKKLKEEALGVVRAKLEQLGKEKIENELRLNEVIVNLQEVRSSQVQVLEAQAQALEEKSRRLVNSERELDQVKISLAEKTSELESEKSRSNNISTELMNLREEKSKHSSLVEELQSSLDSERSKVRESTEIFETLKKRVEKIDESSKVLRLELNSLWDSVREACPELAHSKNDLPQIEENTEDLVASFIQDAKTIKKVVSILGEANETLKEHLDSEKETAKKMSEEAKKRNIELDERLGSFESELQNRDKYLTLLVKRKKHLQGLLTKAVSERDEFDRELAPSIERWQSLNAEAQCILTTLNSDSEEFEQLRNKCNTLKDLISTFNERRISNSKNLVNVLCKIFVWSETTLQEACKVEPSLESQNEFSPETVLTEEIERNEVTRKDLLNVVDKLNEFEDVLTTCETKSKSNVLRALSNEENLRTQLEKVSKERKELKDKLDAARVRNAKMEKNMDELRNSNKKLKTDLSEALTGEEKKELERLRALTIKLEEEKAELAKKTNEKDVDSRLETLHKEYGQKLDKIKQKMKTAYNEQIAKLNQEQEKVLKEKMDLLRHQTEQQCRKYTEDIAKYKAHISDLSSRYWDVGEKLLAETHEKEAALQQLQRLKGQQQEAIAECNEHVTQTRQKTSSLDRRDFSADRLTRDPTGRAGYRAVEVIEEETTTFSTRRHSVKSIQAMGNAFDAEDEGEVFDSVYLADLKEGRCAPNVPDLNRLSELRMRNSLCRPHLKSSYAVETHLQPVSLNEDDIKNGVTGDDVFNDSLSQSLLPGQKPKKKDRTQTSYKRPGPPTPSKNGGRLSLQGNELKSPNSRILKERNVERRTTATPRGLKNLFGTSMSKRQDENTAGTPKGRRLSNIFRKQRTDRN